MPLAWVTRRRGCILAAGAPEGGVGWGQELISSVLDVPGWRDLWIIPVEMFRK